MLPTTYIQVNVAVIIDASGSVSTADWELSKEFAKNTVSSFAEQNLFANGGSASFAQFSSSASEGGTFYSVEDFNAFVDADTKYSGGTDIIDGIAKGRELLNASPTTTSFMIVTTDGAAASPQVRLHRYIRLLLYWMLCIFLSFLSVFVIG